MTHCIRGTVQLLLSAQTRPPAPQGIRVGWSAVLRRSPLLLGRVFDTASPPADAVPLAPGLCEMSEV